MGNSQQFGEVVVTNGGCLYWDANEENDLFIFDSLDVHADSRVVFPGDYRRINAAAGGSADNFYGAGAFASGRVVRVHSGGKIDADGQGFPILMGPAAAKSDFGGAGHGGMGALRNSNTGVGFMYGTAEAPTTLGSGGGLASSGAGGGAIKIAAEIITVSGVISANGSNGTSSPGHGGSGGSIWLVSGILEGDGAIQVNSGFNNGGWRGGGGGKITVLYGETALKRDKVLAGRLDLAREVNSLAGFDGVVSTAAGLGYTGGVQQAGDGVIVYLQVLPPGGTVLLVR